MRPRPLLCLCVVALAACAGGTQPASTPGVTTLTQAELPRAPAPRPALRATLEEAGRGEYDAKVLGARGARVSLRLSNEGDAPADVAGVRVRFEAERAGVAFPCADSARPTMITHEPSTLAPGDAFVYERELGCSLPLPGRYMVRAFVGGSGTAAAEDDAPVATFAFDVAPGVEPPASFATRKGLYAVLTADRGSRPLDPEARARGDYHVGVGLVHGGAKSVRVGPAPLSFVVRKKAGDGRTLDPSQPPREPVGDRAGHRLDPVRRRTFAARAPRRARTGRHARGVCAARVRAPATRRVRGHRAPRPRARAGGGRPVRAPGDRRSRRVRPHPAAQPRSRPRDLAVVRSRPAVTRPRRPRRARAAAPSAERRRRTTEPNESRAGLAPASRRRAREGD